MTAEALARAVLDAAGRRGWTIATAESCTGGMIAAALTEFAGSSAIFDRGWTTYSNDAKTRQLGTPPALIAEHGAVSEPVARAMADGALTNSSATLAVSVTGIAGPGGGTEAKPIGLVWFGLAQRDRETLTVVERFGPLSRSRIRAEATLRALRLPA